MAELKPWQVAPAEQIKRLFAEGAQVVLDGSDTGTGKTYVAAKVLADLGRQALVICPKSSKTNWRRVVSAFDADRLLLDVVNPEALKTGRSPWWNGAKWTLPPGSLLFWDEVHRGASGPKSQQTRMLALTKAFKVPVLAMSATIADSPLKLRALGYLLGLHAYNMQSFTAWCMANGCRRSPFHAGLEFARGTKAKAAMLELHRQMSQCLVRVPISAIPEFPEGLVECELYDLDSKVDKDELAELWDKMAAHLKEPGANQMVGVLRARQRTEFLKVPILTTLTEDLVEEGKSVVIFLNFTETQEALRERLAKFNPVFIHGLQTEKERQQAQDDFQANRAHVCICKIQAGGVSISLHDVNHERERVSLICPSFNAAELRQALGRIRRTGGTRAVQKLVLLADTVEEKVYRSVSRKLENIDALNDGDLTPI